ncbi:MAG: cupin domain-containing protein, partial [Candidatus Nanohaloarchaea archaeon]
DKPWGYEEIVLMTQVDVGDRVGMLGIKRLVIDAEGMTSYSYHDEQADIIYLEEGNAQIRKEGGLQELEKGNALVIRSGEKHQIQNIDSQVAKVLEISFPYKPEDITRVEDPYAEARSDEESQEEY